MKSAKITFSNNEVITIHSDDLIRSVIVSKDLDNDKDNRTEVMKHVAPVTVGIGDTIDLSDPHIEMGVVPDLLDVFHNADYFCFNNDPDTLYSVSSIVKIENL
ncbi:hypothetical protein D1B17_08805 [Companilactobacillus zhachilii]|uniref:Uncharacterized protein n=1 Tax=Companilactobacillus zhachilii TaxID=2304606 RepID=A0A386PRY8_9LACO|nr:hypothetical protein [Companilactobacillus zhachilii]AYE38724.1 hypothetical protein D1B17_08805 [Companilactobacillus zhachilii]